ncbi:S-adenosyl-L-methionine-dependent methyltransferase [Polychaeton citri CBS 116435]|uniref:S-adenosyl-L-methionine-dependent methyltransferase n=1 Tax=Polychaeton citri CBS 116435 TaxID=1314669 RepID=A0A9P4UQE4_9PEZI|nr:S-adenosyl-L-methionine-dependent methyltransferase [Polychaeton citri CBS 116435]
MSLSHLGTADILLLGEDASILLTSISNLGTGSYSLTFARASIVLTFAKFSWQQQSMAATQPEISSLEAKQLVRDGYNNIADTYLDWVLKLPSPRLQYLNQLTSLVDDRANATVLELGCGAGLPCTETLARQVGNVIANDISETQLDLARKHLQSFDNVRYVLGDMSTLDVAAKSLEAVVAFYSVMHLPHQEQHDIMATIYGWLKPGGLLLCTLGDEDNPGVVKDWLGGAAMFWASRDEEASKQMVIDAGFDIVEADVVTAVENRKTVPFLWVLARKV